MLSFLSFLLSLLLFSIADDVTLLFYISLGSSCHLSIDVCICSFVLSLKIYTYLTLSDTRLLYICIFQGNLMLFLPELK